MISPPSDAAPYSEATFYAEATRFLNGDTKGIVTAPELSRLMARIATQETATARARIAELEVDLEHARALIMPEPGGDGCSLCGCVPTMPAALCHNCADDKALAPAAEPESLRAKGG